VERAIVSQIPQGLNPVLEGFRRMFQCEAMPLIAH
jgi:hypothetical protein